MWDSHYFLGAKVFLERLLEGKTFAPSPAFFQPLPEVDKGFKPGPA
jgi:hypothetical protein